MPIRKNQIRSSSGAVKTVIPDRFWKYHVCWTHPGVNSSGRKKNVNEIKVCEVFAVQTQA